MWKLWCWLIRNWSLLFKIVSNPKKVFSFLGISSSDIKFEIVYPSQSWWSGNSWLLVFYFLSFLLCCSIFYSKEDRSLVFVWQSFSHCTENRPLSPNLRNGGVQFCNSRAAKVEMYFWSPHVLCLHAISQATSFWRTTSRNSVFQTSFYGMNHSIKQLKLFQLFQLAIPLRYHKSIAERLERLKRKTLSRVA